ncbi:Imm7 family immunity protein [Kribbella kalugense]|uniref:Immunity protein 7 of polymorphic toxin system n=1 Tax=Kribbella kalugense TaxID=2512221 RepID=A0A4V3G8B2_9ACTN|nr:Imm7 family immunity protein [Kribbella kalugense]TDW22204.1 immunity protein 7 of polymorphic toxin system [Kribbella kalugense]
MFEYHGWATLRDSQDAFGGKADDLSQAAYDAVVQEIAGVRNDLQTADLRIANGSAHLWMAGLRNHRQDGVIETFRRIARTAPWSYGMLHVYDDEAQGENKNRWVVWVMKRGSVAPEADPYLSPHVGVVEDDLDAGAGGVYLGDD